MSSIRNIKKSDYEYIHKAVIDYGTFFSDYAATVINLLIKYNGILSSTLVAETHKGEITGFDINLLKPHSFWNEVYKNLSFFKKFKWLYTNKTPRSTIDKCDNKLQDIYYNLYKTDDRVAYTLFYMFNKRIENDIGASDVGIMQLKLIVDEYEYQTAEIKTDNTASIKSYNKRGFNTTKYTEYEEGVLFSTIHIHDIRNDIKKYIMNCDIII